MYVSTHNLCNIMYVLFGKLGLICLKIMASGQSPSMMYAYELENIASIVDEMLSPCENPEASPLLKILSNVSFAQKGKLLSIFID